MVGQVNHLSCCQIYVYILLIVKTCYISGLVLKGNRIVIPKILPNEMKTLLHNGHFGIVKIKHHAREIMFWHGMNRDIKNIVKTCDLCQQHKRQGRETYIPHEILNIPWIKVGTDLFEIFLKSYLIVVDYTSNFFDISEIPDKRSSTVVLHTKQIFYRWYYQRSYIRQWSRIHRECLQKI